MVEAWAGLEGVRFARTGDGPMLGRHGMSPVCITRGDGADCKSLLVWPSGRASEPLSWTKPFLNSTQLNAGSLRKEKGKLQGCSWCAGPWEAQGGRSASQEGEAGWSHLASMGPDDFTGLSMARKLDPSRQVTRSLLLRDRCPPSSYRVRVCVCVCLCTHTGAWAQGGPCTLFPSKPRFWG